MSKFNPNAFVNDLIKKGWQMSGDKLTPPPKGWTPDQNKKKEIQTAKII